MVRILRNEGLSLKEMALNSEEKSFWTEAEA